MLKAATEEDLQAYLPQALLTWALNQCKGAGQQHIVFFVEEGEDISVPRALPVWGSTCCLQKK